jgi:hypothetical protein
LASTIFITSRHLDSINLKNNPLNCDCGIRLTLYRSYDPYMGHKRFFHCHAGKVGT